MAARHNGGAAISKNYTSQYGAVNMADLSKDNGGRSRRPEKLYKVEAGQNPHWGFWLDRQGSDICKRDLLLLPGVSKLLQLAEIV